MLRHVREPRGLARGRLPGVAAVALSALVTTGAASMAQGAAQGAAPGAGVATAPVNASAATPAETASGDGPITASILQSKIGKAKAAPIEAHISRLHATLKITPTQEPLWQSFAAVMRQNVVQMDAVYAKRESGYGAMNAVQDLISYGEVEEANARNVQMLLPPFQSLYDSFSPEQKKTADTTFLRYTDKAVKKPG